MAEARWKEAHLQKVVKSLPMLDYLKLSQTARLMFYPHPPAPRIFFPSGNTSIMNELSTKYHAKHLIFTLYLNSVLAWITLVYHMISEIHKYFRVWFTVPTEIMKQN